jgi:uncharacterized protein with HEPN domain
MQHHKVEKYFFDIIDAISAIELAKEQAKNYQEFERNRIIRSSIERELITIGEIATILKRQFPDVNISNLKNIAATRNIIVHDYDGVNYKVIWSIIETYIPILKQEVQNLLPTDTDLKIMNNNDNN